jgi:hypothetical protein
MSSTSSYPPPPSFNTLPEYLSADQTDEVPTLTEEQILDLLEKAVPGANELNETLKKLSYLPHPNLILR